VAIAAQWQTVATLTSSSTGVYTVPTNTTAATYAYGGYARDLVVTNSGTTSVSVSFGASASSAATASSFALPVGGTVILTQCQIPNGGIVWGIGPGQVSVGFGTNVSYI
jgi:hypothetical protein